MASSPATASSFCVPWMSMHDRVAGTASRSTSLSSRALIAEAIDLRGDLFLGRRRVRHDDLERVVAGNGDDRADLDDGLERAAGLPRRTDRRSRAARSRRSRSRAARSRSNSAAPHAALLRERRLVPSLASRTRRGALPGRNPSIFTSRARRRNAASTALSNSGLVDLDGQLDLVALKGFSDSLHRRGAVYRRAQQSLSPGL